MQQTYLTKSGVHGQKKDMRKLTLSYDPTYSQTDKSILDTYENSEKQRTTLFSTHKLSSPLWENDALI